jgi:hypothetical protein
MAELRKLVNDGMGKSAPPELPAHLRHAAAAAKDAMQKAATYAEKAAANRQGQEALEAIKAHVVGIHVQAGIKIAHLKPLRFLER